ncbi:peptidoglycan recognition protein-like [Calliphora vicina]|uniref:peptidoglycan recognition protein-like n=1 Tax=Calliphora vicina TaxID=7373 RepID=UPI00325B58C1
MASPSSHEILSVNEPLDDNESLASSIVESSIVDTSSEADEDFLEDCDDDSQKYTNISELPIYNKLLNSNSLSKQLGQITPLATYNNVSVSNSTNVVFGNVIKVKGVLNINVYKETNKNNDENINPSYKSRESSQINKKSSNDYVSNSICRIIPRNCWFALEPLNEYDYIKEPIDIVIISHSATDSSISSTTNMEILRNIQTFHVDSQGWDDIGYNFLIGCDGNIYEGRGWGVVGVHTFGYNSRSIGICFIGSFSRSLPTEKALESCKNLLKRGTNEGHLTQNYKLLCHRQCISTVSPGRLLYEEISKWENFYNKGIDDNLKN